ncbi:alkyl/aryl-sulfatase [Streptomyces sp. NPDC059063]|uniref:alkyl/aryl-sulfatase n=1 Tax=unclassified Streptomyces TaxID=2593676 RepID=UPI0036B5731C
MPEFVEPVQVSASVAEANRKVTETVPPSPEDFENATRGLVAVPDVPFIPARTSGDEPVWDFVGYDFLRDGDETSPAEVNASLWRQGQLTAVAGLFQVVSGPEGSIYQVRGYDLSNMTIIEGDQGIIVLDPLASYETANYALRLYRKATESQKPVVGVIYTHSHVDHFGGVRGLFDEQGGQVPDIPVIAPDGFLEHAVSENVYAGPAMARRAEYMYAAKLDKSPYGQVGSGLGLTISTGEVTLVPPTVSVGDAEHGPVPRDLWTSEDVIPWRPGLYRQTVGGIRMVIQLTPGTEAPAEMNLYFPQFRALCMAENATHTLHNLITLRGAQVRDAHAWSKYLTEALQTFAEHTEVEFASHHWPLWGREKIVEFLGVQRDVYAYLNDQALRLINQGRNGLEIAEELSLPASLADHWYTRGYYGSVSHDLKGVYQRYLGWFDGNPAHLWTYPQAEAGRRYVEAIGGPDAVVRQAQAAYDGGDYRWAAELLNHVVFGLPDQSEPAKQLQARVLSQLGYGAENGTWRDFYLTGARELTVGVENRATQEAGDLVNSLSLEQYFAAMARSVDGPKAAAEQRTPIALQWRVTGTPEQSCTTTLRNGVLVFVPGKDILAGTPQATITLSRAALNGLYLSGPDFPRNFRTAVEKGEITLGGPEQQAYADTVFGYLTLPNPKFPIVAPAAPGRTS